MFSSGSWADRRYHPRRRIEGREEKKLMIWKNKLSALFATRFQEQVRYLPVQTVTLFVRNARENLAQRAEQSWEIIDLSLQSRLLKEFCMIVRMMNVMTNFLINCSIKVFDILMFEFAISCKLNLPYFWNQLQTFGCLFSQLNVLHLFFFIFLLYFWFRIKWIRC